MPTQIDDRQVVNRAPLSALGNTANATLDVIMGDINALFAAATFLPTSSVLMTRDANANTQANNFLEGFATTATAAATTTLVVGSKYFQQFTGTTTQTVVLPNATTLTAGQSFCITNRSTGNVTVQTNGGASLQVLTANSQALFTCTSIGTSAGTWDVSYTVTGPSSFLQTQSVNDSTTTGSAATLQTTDIAFGVVRLTNGSLASVSGIPAGASGQQIVVENQTGVPININNNDSGATAANRIFTGTNGPVSMAANASFQLVYDTTAARWMIVGGTGSGSGGSGGKNYLSAITTSQSSTPNTGNGNFELGSTAGWSLFNTTLNYAYTSTFTVTVASPAVFTTPANHNLALGQAISFTTTGALPTGLTSGTTYYVTAIPSATSFRVTSNPYGGADLNTTGTQSGTHTIRTNPQLTTGSIAAGAASVTSFGVISSGQLAGSFSLQTASSSTWTAGQGFLSDAFFIDTEDKTNGLPFSATYKVTAGATNLYLPGNLSNSFAIYAYDVTNSIWITPLGLVSMNGSGQISGSFQTSSNGTQYRIAIVCLNQTLGAATLIWDDFVVGPNSASAFGSSVVSWVGSAGSGQVVTANVTDVGLATIKDSNSAWNGFQYAVPVAGDYIFCGVVSNSGSSNTAQIYKNGSALPSTAFFSTQSVSNAQGGGSILIPNCKQGDLLSIRCSVSGTISDAYLGIYLLQGAQVGAPGQVVDWNGTFSSQAVGGTGSDIPFTTSKDSSGAWNGTQYVVQVAGDYLTTGAYQSPPAQTAQVYLNGSPYTLGGFWSSCGTGSFTAGAVLLTNLKPGDKISVRSQSATTLSNGQFSVMLLQGPSSQQATVSVEASYFCSTTFSCTANTQINYDSREYDTHSAVTVGTGWKFTAPMSGLYNIGGFAAPSGNFGFIMVYKNGSPYKTATNGNGNFSSTWPNTDIHLNEGDFIDLRPTNGGISVNGGTLATSGTAHISIKRVGN